MLEFLTTGIRELWRRRWAKWLLGAGFLASLPFVFFWGVNLFLDQSRYKVMLSDAVEQRTGRPLYIDGDVGVRLFSWSPTIYIESVRYPNAAWGKMPAAAKIEQILVSLDLRALLERNIVVTKVRLERPMLWVEDDGAGNYNFSFSAAEQPPKFELRKYLPERFELVGGEIHVLTDDRDWEIELRDVRGQRNLTTELLAFEVQGALEQVPVTAELNLQPTPSQPTMLWGEAHLGDSQNRLQLRGEIQDILRWHGVELGLQFELARTEQIHNFPEIVLPDLGTVQGSAQLSQPGGGGTMALREIDLHFTQWGLRTRVTGKIERVFGLEGVEVTVATGGALALDELFEDPEVSGAEGWLSDLVATHSAPLQVAVRATTSGSPQQTWRLQVSQISLQNAFLDIRGKGELVLDEGRWQGSLPLFATLRANPNAQQLAGQMVAVSAPLQATAQIKQVIPPDADTTIDWRLIPNYWRLDDIVINSAEPSLNLNLRGVLYEFGSDNPSGSFQLRAQAYNSKLLHPFSTHLTLDKASVNATLFLRDESFRTRVDQLTAELKGAQFSARGGVQQLFSLVGINLDVQGSTKNLRELRLPEAFNLDLPSTAPLGLRGTLVSGSDEIVHFDDLHIFIKDAPIQLDARGSIRDLGENMRADLAVDLRLAENDEEPVQTFFEYTLESGLGEAALPINATANLYSTSAVAWKMRDIKVTAGEGGHYVDVRGSIDEFVPLTANLAVAVKDLSVARLPDSWDIPRPIDAVLDFSLDLEVVQDTASSKNVSAKLRSPEVNASVTAQVTDFSSLAMDAMQLEFTADNAEALNWEGAGLLPENAISLSMDAVRGKNGHNLSHFTMKFGKSDIGGTFLWLLSPEDTLLLSEASWASQLLDLGDIWIASADYDRVFTTDLINTSWISPLEGQITWYFTQVRDTVISIRNATARINFARGKLRQTLDGFVGAGRGRAEIAIELDTNHSPPALQFAMRGEGLDAEGLAILNETEEVSGGLFDVDVEFQSSGDSLSEIAVNANGYAELRLNGMSLKKSDSLNLLGGDLFTNFLIALNPFVRIRDENEVECSIFRFTFSDGVAQSDGKLAIRTRDVAVLGSGAINLHDESLAIIISPKARRGLGINPTSLAKLGRIGGTLIYPKIEADSSRWLETGATWVAGIYSGGLTLLIQGLADRHQGNTDICKLAE